MHAHMDTTDWLKSIVHEECGMDSSSSSSGEIISCARPPVMERRLRPQHDQPLKCPRCDSTHTKFCYYNNYSLSQPRYFCKTCRRYWTKGGSLRNVPVGGGCRKNKRHGAKKPGPEQQPPPPTPLNPLAAASTFRDGADLHLASFPALQLSHLGSLTGGGPHGLNLLECKYDTMFEGHSGGVDGGEFGAVLGNPRNLLFVGGGGGGSGGDVRGMGSLGGLSHGFPPSSSFDGVAPLGFPVEGSHTGGMFMNSCHRLGLPLEGQEEDVHCSVDMKPSGKLLSLEWQDQACADVGRDGFGYSGSLGLWAGMMNSHSASNSHPLI